MCASLCLVPSRGQLLYPGSSSDSDSVDSAEAAEMLRRNRERELSLLQDALDGKVGADSGSRDVFMRRYMACRAHEQTLLHDLMRDKQALLKVGHRAVIISLFACVFTLSCRDDLLIAMRLIMCY